MSNSLLLHGLQHVRLPCPSPTPGACLNSHRLSWWCHLYVILSSIVPFSYCLQSFLASGYFLMSQLFASDSQSIGGSASVLPMNIPDWLPLGLTDLISLQSKGLSRVFSNTTAQKHQFYSTQLSLCESCTVKKVEHWRTDASELWCWWRLLRESHGLQRDQTSQS